jgi:NitT/TauT family transport system substrate-binding protein
MFPTRSVGAARALLGLLCLTLSFSGCLDAPSTPPGSSGPPSAVAPPADAGPTKVKVAYLGLTCEAAMFVAQEKGFFKEEGLDVEFVKTDWDGLRDGLGLGRFDANYTLIMYLLKPIEQGLDVKITGGIHSGCLRVQASPDSPIKTVADLKGKKIGIPTYGSPPFLFACRALAAAGMDPKTDVEWVVLAPEVMGLAIDNKQVDAVADSEPLGSILAATKNVHTIVDQAVDEPYRDEYCCATVVSGKLLQRDPVAAAKVTRALLKGAMWVDTNPTAAAELSVANKYVASKTEINAQAIAKLTYIPGVSGCRDSVLSAAREMKTAGLLNPSTDPDALAKQAWVDLDGVTDEWIKGLKIEKVAGGGRPPVLSQKELVKLFTVDKDFKLMCCDGCCVPLDSLCRP